MEEENSRLRDQVCRCSEKRSPSSVGSGTREDPLQVDEDDELEYAEEPEVFHTPLSPAVRTLIPVEEEEEAEEVIPVPAPITNVVSGQRCLQGPLRLRGTRARPSFAMRPRSTIDGVPCTPPVPYTRPNKPYTRPTHFMGVPLGLRVGQDLRAAVIRKRRTGRSSPIDGAREGWADDEQGIVPSHDRREDDASC